MDRADAIAALPPTYQQVLQLVATNCPDEEIARQLDVEAQAVRSLIDLAEAKLARLTNTAAEPGINGGKEEQ